MIYMVKKQVLTSIDAELHEKAKEKLFNISAVLEKALREKLGNIEVRIDEEKVCGFCGTVDGEIVWLYPDEKWVCNSCLRKRSYSITK